jgi:RNA polymerase sigma-70 factor, ECF subfamily
MSGDPEEAELLLRAGHGDEAAFGVLYERHRTPVFRFAYRLLGAVSAAEDVTQDSFLAVVKKPELFDYTRASLRTYMCGVARNLAFRVMRRQGVETMVDEVLDTPNTEAEPQPLRRLLDDERAEGVRSAIMELPPLQREALILFEYHEMSLVDIAAVTETNVGTIKARLHRARERLKRRLQPWMTAAPALAECE